MPPVLPLLSRRAASGARGLGAVALAALLLVGCDFEVTVPIDVPELEPALVVYAFPSPDSAWAVRVGRTRPLSERAAGPRVENAEVRLYEDGALVETLVYDGGDPDGPDPSAFEPLAVYRSAAGLRPRVGPTYRVEVTAPGLPPASGETRLPDPPVATVSDAPAPGPPGSQRRRLRVTLDDPTGEDVYELALLSRIRYEGFPDAPEQFRFFSSPSPSFRSGYEILDVDVAGGVDTDFCCGVVFRDRLFDGRRTAFEITYDAFFSNPDAEETLSVLMIRVSPEYADHEIRRAQQRENVDNPFAEPSPLYSNVQGGHGVVAGFTPLRLAVPPLGE